MIELICCLSLFCLVVAMGAYAYGQWLPRYRLEGAVRCLVSDFQAVRMKAIAQNRSFRICIRPERSEYFLERETMGALDTWAGPAEGTVRKFDDPSNPYYFPGVTIVNRTHDPVFLPRGGVIGTTVTLKNSWGQRRVVLSSLGRIRVLEE